MIKISVGEKIKLRKLIELLIQKGYSRDNNASQSGTFSMQGDLLLIWPVNQTVKYRLDLFGNIVENIFRLNQGQKQAAKKLKILDNIILTEDGRHSAPTYIVHPHHGIGIFKTIVTRRFDQKPKQFILLEYAKEDKIYFPIKRSQELLAYLGSRKPRLTRLNSGSWEKTKKRITKNLLIFARELLEIYSQRSINKRPLYTADKSFLKILAKSFEYQLTSDQKKSLLEIIAGLTEKDYPQDHLLVGDVGFGKTEVALRAASIVLANGKQATILVPTTVLAAQHAALIRERFKNLPLKVAELSRFNWQAHGTIVQEINTGKVDIIVGTHRLLSSDINFKDLGLLIVDEEQRFGVEQKEKLKKIRQTIDVLSLSATPIPRTLFMSLSGLRSLSLISKPLVGRKGVKTQIIPFRNSEVASAIKREINRRGQIYYIHNRVRNIHVVLQKLIEILKKNQINAVQYQANDHTKNDKVIIAVAHGQMPENILADVMSKFISGDIDILISSTIVENGLDHPNANTLIVEDVERFGLADLYQLQGRIGRRHRQAYAQFFIGNILSGEKDIPIITHKARERFLALADAEEIGSGWQLALKDMEIRGSGNLLGREQHGYMEAVGLLLYSKLLKEAIDQVKKEQLKKHLIARIESERLI